LARIAAKPASLQLALTSTRNDSSSSVVETAPASCSGGSFSGSAFASRRITCGSSTVCARACGVLATGTFGLTDPPTALSCWVSSWKATEALAS
jgi:hypothetical protein